MKNLLLTAGLLLLFSGQVFSQISGFLKDEKGNAITYANVALLRAKDSVTINGTITDMDGKFTIPSPPEGLYLLRLSAISYLTRFMAPFQVNGKSFRNDFGVLTLKEDAKLLAEVTVRALRPTIIMKADKMVVSVEGTALAAGSSAYEVLEKAPGVWVDQDGNIQLNGKAGVRVLIDGRPTYLSGKELQSMLEGMSAENVKNIEVISNPSAKYEAAGSSGILNIRLKQNTIQGINGSISSGYQYNQASGYSSGMNLNYKKGKWNSYINADMARRPRLREGVMIREFHSVDANARFHQLRNENLTLQSPALRMGTDYELNSKHSIGAMFNLNYNSTNRRFFSDTQLDDRIKKESNFIKAGNFYDASNNSGAFNLHYNGQLDTMGTSLALSLDYIQLDNQMNARYENQYNQQSNINSSDELLRTNNPGFYNIYSANADFSKKIFSKTNLELGAKASHVVSGNELNFYTIHSGIEELDAKRSNNYRYTEDIYAGYINLNMALDKKWRLQAGLRAEQTVGKGEPVAGGEIVSKNYFDLFPSLFLTQKVNDQYQVTYNYSRRIDRPNYRTLNPFIFYQDPYSWAEGNPGLRSQYTNSFQITQTLKNTYSLMLAYSLTKDFFAEVPQQNPADNTTVYQERNIDQAEDLSATLMLPIRINSSWDISNNLVAGLQKNKIFLQDKELKNNQFFFTVQSSHNVLLPLGLQLQATAAYSSPSTFGIYRFEPQWWLDAGVKKALMNKKLDVTLGATDVFRTREIHGDASYNGNVFNFVNYFMMRSVKVNLRYNFQKGQNFKSKNRKIQLDELNRAGGQ
ncbi:MAG TPA: outer membrane beta-barrel family protein [Daejeonella sp.]|nr:outer membrane beta-barrel family protein [Daejeonella sp.]